MKFTHLVSRFGAATSLTLCLALPAAGATTPPPHGVFGLVNISTPWQAAVERVAAVRGVTLMATWAELEPAPGQFAWAALDADVTAAAQAGKQVAIDVTPGAFSPSWLYGQGAAKFTYKWTLNWGFPQCSMVSFPLPWDPVYGAAWKAFVAAFGQRYAGNPAVAMVKIVGVSAETSELLLPFSTLGHTPPNGLVCGNTPVAPASAWKAAGYRPSKITAAWNTYTAAFVAAFPTQQLMVPTGSWAFPPVDESGNVVSGSNGDTALPISLLQAAAAAAGDRLAVQNAGLSANWSWPRPAYLPASIALAYQTASPVTGDAGCRMNGGMSPCDPATVLKAAVARSNTAGVKMLELYPQDLLNPALTAAVASFGN